MLLYRKLGSTRIQIFFYIHCSDGVSHGHDWDVTLRAQILNYHYHFFLCRKAGTTLKRHLRNSTNATSTNARFQQNFNRIGVKKYIGGVKHGFGEKKEINMNGKVRLKYKNGIEDRGM